MKKIFFPILISVIACNNSSTTTTPAPAATEQKAVAEEVDKTPQAYFKGAGKDGKNDWSFEMTSAIDGSFPATLTLADGVHSGTFHKAALMVKDKPNMDTNEVKFEGTFEGAEGGEASEVIFTSGSCDDPKANIKLIIKRGKSNLDGCGAYAE